MSYPHEDARTPHGACAAPPPQLPPRHFSTIRGCSRRNVLRAQLALRRYRREDCEEIARPGPFDRIERDAGNGIGYGAADTLDNGLVRIGEQDV